MLIDTLKEFLQDESFLVHCEQTLDELQTFVVTAASSPHDDSMMALGLAARIPARSMFKPQAGHKGILVGRYGYFEAVYLKR